MRRSCAASATLTSSRGRRICIDVTSSALRIFGAALGTIPGALTWYGITREIHGVQARDPGEMAVALDRVSASIEELPVT